MLEFPPARRLRLLLYVACWGMILLLPGVLFSQDFHHYRRLQPSGQIPDDFLLSTSEKVQLAIGDSESQNQDLQKATSDFYQENFYYINQLLLSGKVLFNDSVTNYISEIGDILLRDQPELRRSIRFYAVKSPSANAFATNSGVILVNMGLIARLKNEAQLAFILCHEISHYLKNHPLDIFLQNRDIEANSGGLLRRQTLEDILLAKNNYSKEKEQEADLAGLEIFLKSGYSLDHAISAFDVLKWSHLPFGDVVFERSFFETESLRFPPHYFLDDLAKVRDRFREYDESKSTHPNPDTRREIIIEKLRDISNADRKTWILGENRFHRIVKISRFESCFYLLSNKNYESAIYHAYFLLKEEPNSFYLKKIIAQALYSLVKYSNTGQFWNVHKDYEEVQGNPQQIYHLFEKMEEDEMNILALVYCWNLMEEEPADAELNLMIEDLMQELFTYHVDDMSFFFHTSPSVAERDSEPFIRYSLIDLLQKPAFRTRMNNQLEYVRKEVRHNNSRRNTSGNQVKNKSREKALKGFNLGLDHVVFVDPFYQRVDDRKENGVDYLVSENSEQNFRQLIEKYARETGLKYDLITADDLGKNDISQFRELILLNEWINEKTSFDEKNFVSFYHEEVQFLRQKYGTRYFVWTGALSLTRPRTGKAMVLAAGLIFPPILPYSFYYAITPNHDTMVYTMIYNIETGRYLVLYPKLIKMKDKPDVLNSVAYDLIYQIKTQ